ncbi:hypothetical protein [Arthrobacter sp. ISL-30]|uniref:hypothetical protein n=1 Tax=Arthrobacter sp. ISL-30 TaxID=2819109 RepID=UPI001BE86915|nr:hypothetical protein [Arthrobacter sp. ISL-30]MBT2515461.1 hypothetical protein [Arthrobacter sp. ISL-30]
MGSDPVPGRRFPDAPSYDVHRRVVETYARDLPSSNSLLDALAKRSNRGGRKAEFEFTATPYNFCEVLSVASPETAVALLDAGITTADEAVAFLEEQGLDDLVEDNHDVAEVALRWAAMPSEVLDRFQHAPVSFYDDAEGFGEKLGEDLLGKLRRNQTVWVAVQERRIDLRDILQIGISRFLDAEDNEGTLSGLLASLKSDADQRVRAEDISGWIERFRIGRETPNEVKEGVYRLAVRHGADLAAQIPRDARTMRLANDLSRIAHRERRRLDFERRLILFGAEVLALASGAARPSAPLNEHDLMRLADAGITAAQAAEGYLRGMSAAQMIAVHRDGSFPGVPDGWI